MIGKFDLKPGPSFQGGGGVIICVNSFLFSYFSAVKDSYFINTLTLQRSQGNALLPQMTSLFETLEEFIGGEVKRLDLWFCVFVFWNCDIWNLVFEYLELRTHGGL